MLTNTASPCLNYTESHSYRVDNELKRAVNMHISRLAKLSKEVKAFNEEKERMQAIVVRDDDIIHLNVGGQKFTTKRSTLR